jgi:hypothetical protein
MSPLGISSVKTGVEGNLTSAGRDAMESDSENRSDTIEKRDSSELVWDVELVLLTLAPSICCRRSAMCRLNWVSKGF